MLLDTAPAPVSAARLAVRQALRADEALLVEQLAGYAELDAGQKALAAARARDLVAHVRQERRRAGGIDALMQEYDLSSAEGVALMCLAEALLRIPDAETTDAFIEDKLAGVDWAERLGSDNAFVNVSTFGLMLAGRTLNVDDVNGAALARLTKRLGEPVIRTAVRQAMRILGRQFVMGRTIEEALKRAKPIEARGYRYSYDMLGEAARTTADAERYYDSYVAAIEAVGAAAAGRGPISSPGVSVKLSALHPRYDVFQRDRVLADLKPKLISLARLAARLDVGLCLDAEEADRLDLSMDLIRATCEDSETATWGGLGLAVQAYQKRAFAMIGWLEELAQRTRRRLLVRLVKGAYWDTEIKFAQEAGLPGYPVFTRKSNTDVSYLACAKRMLEAGDAFYPCFATHNANSAAAILALAGTRRDFEFQRLHGMGEALYEPIVEGGVGVSCRIYAPVGGHEDLLAYLVRRLLENGANTSFVNRIADDQAPIEEIIADPVERARALGLGSHPAIPAPKALFGAERANSAGIDFRDPLVIEPLRAEMMAADADRPVARPLVGETAVDGPRRAILNPADQTRNVGEATWASGEDARRALSLAAAAHPAWASRPVGERAAMLRRAADRFEADAARLIRLIVREAGRSVVDSHLEVREAVDFLRYYAASAERLFAAPTLLPGPTGEINSLRLEGRGPFLCISPWNFPLAIFVGQVAAALAAGCPALAKPAEQTPLIAAAAIAHLRAAGIPADVLAFLPGDGPTIGGALLKENALAGVAFTGSTDTARIINRALADRAGAIIPLIAETGGINAMIVDSTALPEQVARDVLASAFQSAGQRCSALRLLFVQADVADKQIAMIAGAMKELRLGDPAFLSTDVGPVIDVEARDRLTAYKADIARRARLIGEASIARANPNGLFVAPAAYELADARELTEEVFGPILHVVRYRAAELDAVVDQINASGYGLTLSVHTRAESRARRIAERARVGNIYINRNQIGAVVGVQPFGGEGLSGTGPKAGGPHYLLRFASERTLSTDTTASGGNASLMTLDA